MSLIGYSPRGRKESDTTEWLHFFFYKDLCNYIGLTQIIQDNLLILNSLA